MEMARNGAEDSVDDKWALDDGSLRILGDERNKENYASVSVCLYRKNVEQSWQRKWRKWDGCEKKIKTEMFFRIFFSIWAVRTGLTFWTSTMRQWGEFTLYAVMGEQHFIITEENGPCK